MTRRGISHILLLLCCFCSLVVSAQPQVSATLDSTRILIGDQLKLHLNARYPAGTQLLPPDLSFLDSLETVEVIDITQADTLSEGSNILYSQDLTITSFDSGSHFIPAIPFRYVVNGRSGLVATNELLLEVGVPQIDTIPLAPIKWIMEEPFSIADYYGWLIGVAVAVLLGFAIWWFIKRRGKATTAPPAPVVVIPAHEIALKKLAELREAKLWQQGEIKSYHSQLTYIVREYLENRYDLQALESTTDEIVKQLKSINIGKDMTDQLRNMFQQADLVKFAKAKPAVEIHDKQWALAESFVIQTKAKPIAPEDSPAATADNQQLSMIGLVALWSDDISFGNPGFFLLLLLIPLMGALYFFRHNQRYASLRMSSLESIRGLQSLRGRLRALLPILRLLSFIALVIALARPQLTLKEEEIKADGIDIMLVMDLSSSMLAQDFKPDRLEVSKKVASDFVDKRQFDRIGLAVFAGEAFTQCPLTTDHVVLKEFLANLECGILEDGTAIGMGLATAVNRLKESEAKSKVVILVTDGDNNAGYVKPLTAAEI
ncbi:MAG: VWA domain-containing protein, partial [Bacteroidota bacterium]